MLVKLDRGEGRLEMQTGAVTSLEVDSTGFLVLPFWENDTSQGATHYGGCQL